jgi:hypothetical protein
VKNILNYDRIEIGGITTILKGRLEHAICDEIEEIAKPFVENVECNLQNTKRTGWRVFEKPEFAPVFQKFSDKVTETILSYAQARPILGLGHNGTYNVNCRYFNAWVAWYSSDSFVQPHQHGGGEMFSPEYSLSAYLKVPDDSTELTFVPRELKTTENYKIEVKQGDFLIFPSSLMHYTNDCKEGRVILSANFTVTAATNET